MKGFFGSQISINRVFSSSLCALLALVCFSSAVSAQNFSNINIDRETLDQVSDIGYNAYRPGKSGNQKDSKSTVSKAVKAFSKTAARKPAPAPKAKKSAAATIKPARETISNDHISDDDETFLLNADDIEIATLVKLVSRLTKRNYILDEKVKGRLSIFQPEPLPMVQLIKTFEDAIQHKGFASVPMGGNTWKIVLARDAKTSTIPLLMEKGSAEAGTIITKLVKLTYADAQAIRPTLQRFVSRDGVVEIAEGTNSLIIVDSVENIKRLENLVEEIDFPAENQQTKVIPIKHASAEDLAEKINRILAANPGTRKSSQVVVRRGRAQRQTRTEAGKGPEGEVFSDDRTNSLIAVGTLKLIEKVEGLVEELDSPIDRSNESFFLYKLQNADAEELVEILNQIISGNDGGSDPAAPRGLRSRRGSSLSRQRGQNQPTPAAASNGRNNQFQAGRRVNFEEGISIAADTRTNSVVVNASQSDYDKLVRLIKQLDVKRKQVLVEAAVIEVTMGDQQDLGLDFRSAEGHQDGVGVLQGNFSNLPSVLGAPGAIPSVLESPGALQGLSLQAISQGTLTLPGGIAMPTQSVVLNALQLNSAVNVLSSPSIMTSDNEEAEIIVGENVPVVTSRATDGSNLGNQFSQIDRQDVGITLRITPQITNGEYVNLKIFVEISSVVPGTRNAENGLTTNVRTTETSVVVKNNQMVITGGLLSDNTIEQEAGIPLLMEIPVLGNLFKSKNESVQQTNLLIFITPRIINDDISAEMTTDYFSSRLPKSVEKARETLRSPMIGQMKEDEEEKPFIEEDVVDDLDF